ncbi:MAG: permease prefix domain 1-containing protein [Amnibacterium sp.]
MSIDEFLDAAFPELTGAGAAGRRALAEAEDHLRASAADGVARGLTREDAEADAVARFGSPVRFARQVATANGGGWGPLLTGAWALGGLLGVVVGIAGVASDVLGATIGPMFVAGDRYGVTYAAWRCAEYLRDAPAGSSCATAAALDHWGEVAMGREAVGVLGLLALLALAVARRTALRGSAWRLPWAAVAAVGAVALGIAAVVRGLPDGATALLSTTTGTGAGIVDGITAAVFAAVLLGVAVRRRSGVRALLHPSR